MFGWKFYQKVILLLRFVGDIMLYIITTGQYDDYHWVAVVDGPDNLDINEIENDFENRENHIKYFDDRGITYRNNPNRYTRFEYFEDVWNVWRSFYDSEDDDYINWFLKKWNLTKLDITEISI